jgi:hypothetical protein
VDFHGVWLLSIMFPWLLLVRKAIIRAYTGWFGFVGAERETNGYRLAGRILAGIFFFLLLPFADWFWLACVTRK